MYRDATNKYIPYIPKELTKLSTDKLMQNHHNYNIAKYIAPILKINIYDKYIQ